MRPRSLPSAFHCASVAPRPRTNTLSDAVAVAVAAVDDAYEAAIEAIIARGDADEVSPVKLSA